MENKTPGTLTSKQRAYLRSLAAGADTILHIGKGGITENVIQQADEALRARELIKGHVLENAPVTAREACAQLAELCHAEQVQAIGGKFVLFRRNPKKAIIEVPSNRKKKKA